MAEFEGALPQDSTPLLITVIIFLAFFFLRILGGYLVRISWLWSRFNLHWLHGPNFSRTRSHMDRMVPIQLALYSICSVQPRFFFVPARFQFDASGISACIIGLAEANRGEEIQKVRGIQSLPECIQHKFRSES